MSDVYTITRKFLAPIVVSRAELERAERETSAVLRNHVDNGCTELGCTKCWMAGTLGIVRLPPPPPQLSTRRLR